MSEELIESTVAEIETVQPVSPETSDILTVSKHEEEARAKGWRPKEEFVGDPAEFRGAKEWLERGEILDTVHSLKRQLKEQSESLQHMAEFTKKIETVTREKTISEIEARHRAAVEVGDIATATAAVKEMVKASVDVSLPQPATAPIDPEVHAFVARNSAWFNENNAENTAMKSFALKRDAELAVEMKGASPTEIIKRLESDVHRLFPHKFQSAPVSAVGAPSGSPPKSKEAAIPEYHRKMIDKLSRTVKGFDKKAYIDLCKQIGEIA